MKRITFICAKGFETFIKPIVKELDKSNDYICDAQYLNLQDGQDKIITQMNVAINWADIVWFEWANELAVLGTIEKLCPEIKNKEVIVRLHSYEALTDMPKQINWENVDRLIFVAEHIHSITNTYNLIPAKVEYVIIPNGVDMTKCKIMSKVQDPYKIACVGNINHKKDPSTLLQIMQKLVLRHPGIKLYIAGAYQDRRYEVYLPYMIKNMNLTHNIIFDGFVKDMSKWYQDKSVLLSTSIHEGHSCCITEAMARGIYPVIHNFFGSSEQYPPECLYNTVDEAVFLIEDAVKREKKWLREWIIDHKWTFKDQIRQTREIIDGI